MTQDDFKLLNALRSELQFLETGGYKHSSLTPWRAPFIFEGSPICVNHGSAGHARPCSECLLLKFVPEDRKREASPCQFVPLTEAGESIHLFYRYGTEFQMEEALGNWLRKQISKIEGEIARTAKLLEERTSTARMLPGCAGTGGQKEVPSRAKF